MTFTTIAGTGREAGKHGGDCPDGGDPVTGMQIVWAIFLREHKRLSICVFAWVEKRLELKFYLVSNKHATLWYREPQSNLEAVPSATQSITE